MRTHAGSPQSKFSGYVDRNVSRQIEEVDAILVEIQEELLLKIRDVIERTGTGIAIPSQRLYVSADLLNQPIAQGSKASEISSVPNARLMHSRR